MFSCFKCIQKDDMDNESYSKAEIKLGKLHNTSVPDTVFISNSQYWPMRLLTNLFPFLTAAVTNTDDSDKIAAIYAIQAVSRSCRGSTADHRLAPGGALLHLDSQGTADSFRVAPNAQNSPKSSSDDGYKEELLQELEVWEAQGLFEAVIGPPERQQEEVNILLQLLSTFKFLYYIFMFGLYLVGPLLLLAVTAARLFGSAYVVLFVICCAVDCLMLVLSFTKSFWKYEKQCIGWWTGLTMVIGGCVLWPFALVALVVCIPLWIIPLAICPNELKEDWMHSEYCSSTNEKY
jgi:hypothetical protein